MVMDPFIGILDAQTNTITRTRNSAQYLNRNVGRQVTHLELTEVILLRSARVKVDSILPELQVRF